ncbi:MAG: DUF2232 domain-containing protein [Pseudomonadota bacterium]|nr:DUF2232 domain-containing protein [Pseudomonadota bacterium]
MIGKYVLSGGLQAVLAITLSTLISLLLLPKFIYLINPFSYLISGSVVSLITLKKGMLYTLQPLVLSWFILLALGITQERLTQEVMIIWLPILFLSGILRFSENQGVLIFFAGLATIIFYLIIGDLSAWWNEGLSIAFEQALPSEHLDAYQLVFDSMAKLMNTLVMFYMLITILFARWWQSRLFNSGGFRKEFYALRVPKIVLPIFVVTMILAFSAGDLSQDIFRDILVVLIFMYLIQGLSFVHRTIDKLKLSVSWLIVLYCLLMFVPHTGLIISCLGIVDTFSEWHNKNQGSKKES